jgi:hypothetical protein
VGNIPKSETLNGDGRAALAAEEGFDPMAIELAMAPQESTFWSKLQLMILVFLAMAAVFFFFPTERFFKPQTQNIGTLTIGGPVLPEDVSSVQARNQPWLKVLLQIDQLYFQKGNLTAAIRLAESELRKVPAKDWQIWRKVHYRYWELLFNAGRMQRCQDATQKFRQYYPEDPFANYYHAKAFLADVEHNPISGRAMRKDLRREAAEIVQQLELAGKALQARLQHPEYKKSEFALRALYQKLRLEQARLNVTIWKLGGYREDEHPDVAYRDEALRICNSPALKDMKEAKELKINIYSNILDRWYWFEGQQIIQGSQHRRRSIQQKVDRLKEELEESQAL